MNRSPNQTRVLRLMSGLVFAGGLALVVGTAGANPPPPPGPPPPEAFKACEGKARGDVCSVQLHDTTLQGVCDAPPGESRLACRPNGPPPPPPPPPEAFKACEGKARGDVCSVQLRGTTIQGVCDAPPGQSVLACRPNSPPPPPPPPPPEAFKACEGKVRGDACAVQLPDGVVQGICDAPPGESRLACRPHGPPPPPPPPPEDDD